MPVLRTSDGCEIATYDFGGSGGPLLFAHATGFNAAMWLPVIEQLRGRFRCYAFDERGHGASPTPANGDFSWERMGDDAREVAASFGLVTPGVIGHSAGGALLVLAEERHPGSWSGMWLYEPVIRPPMEAPAGPLSNPLANGALRRRDHFPTREAAFDNFASKPPFDAFDRAVLTQYIDHGWVDAPEGGVMLACRREDEAATYNQALHHRAWDRLDGLALAVHVVAGAASTHMPGEFASAVAARIPGAVLEVMEGLGHFGPFEDPARVAASIEAFFV